MKSKSLPLALVLAALAGPVLAPRATAAVSFSFFYDSLSPHGEWIEVGSYGECWRPSGVNDDWAPYTDGYWAYTDGGWTWVSYEDWGDITYHYGRWVRVEGEGWCWVPDTEWAPAWVSWRSNDDYVGWAPLPPEARWEPSVGFSVWVDTSYDIGPSYYNFCHTRDFGAPVLAPVCLPRERNVTIIQETVNITNITYHEENTVIFNGGPNFVNINRRAQRQIPALKLVREDRVFGNEGRGGGRGNWRTRQQGNQLAVYAPPVERLPRGERAKIRPARVIPAERVNRGWAQVSDPKVKERVREKMKEQNRGRTPQTAPAERVREQDLAVVPKKADPKAPSPIALERERRPGKRDKQVASTETPGTSKAAEEQPKLPGTPPNELSPREGENNRPEKRVAGEKRDRRESAEGMNPAVAGVPAPDTANQDPRQNREGKRERGDKGAVVSTPEAPRREASPSDDPTEKTPEERAAGKARREAARAQAEKNAPERPESRPPQPFEQIQTADPARAQEREQRRQQQEKAQSAAAQQQEQAKAQEREQRRQQREQMQAAEQQQQQQAAKAEREAAVRRSQGQAERQAQNEKQAASEARRQQREAEVARQAGEARRQQQREAASAQQAAEARRAQQQDVQRASEARRQQQQQQQAESARRQSQAMDMQRDMQQQRRAERPPQQAVERPQHIQRSQPPVQRMPQQIQRAPRPSAPAPAQGGGDGQRRRDRKAAEEAAQR